MILCVSWINVLDLLKEVRVSTLTYLFVVVTGRTRSTRTYVPPSWEVRKGGGGVGIFRFSHDWSFVSSVVGFIPKRKLTHDVTQGQGRRGVTSKREICRREPLTSSVSEPVPQPVRTVTTEETWVSSRLLASVSKLLPETTSRVPP